jgi:predicted O-methyltransferase YrrM
VSVAGTAEREFDSVLASLEGVEGWLSDDQARRLWDAAGRVHAPGRIVEIGSFRGRSTIVLRRAAAEGVEVVAVDPHGGGDRGPQEITPDSVRGDEDHRVFNANLERAGVGGTIRHVRRMSNDALGEVEAPFDVLYVDGAHRYAPAKADIEQWGDRVKDGGTLLVHDSYNAVGVMLAQARLLFASGRWRYVGRSRSLAEYRREQLSAGARAANLLHQLGSVPWFVRNCVLKVLLVARQRSLARRLGLPDGDDWPY